MNNIQAAPISYFKSWTITIQCVHRHACRYTMFSDTRVSFIARPEKAECVLPPVKESCQHIAKIDDKH